MRHENIKQVLIGKYCHVSRFGFSIEPPHEGAEIPKALAWKWTGPQFTDTPTFYHWGVTNMVTTVSLNV